MSHVYFGEMKLNLTYTINNGPSKAMVVSKLAPITSFGSKNVKNIQQLPLIASNEVLDSYLL